MLNNFVKSYPQPKDGPAFQYTTMVRHNGTVIAFAVNAARRVLYSVLDLSDQGKKGPLDVNYWQDNPQELLFPTEVVTVGEGLFNPRIMPVYKKGASEPEPEGTRVKSAEKDLFRSTTASLTELAPIQVVSDHKFVYVFRQSQENEAVGMAAGTLLVDRFVLSGINLLPKREVRYQRSRNKFTPQSRKDGLGAKDMEQIPFYEPTQKLSFIRNLHQGRLAVLLLPTQVANVQRWQIFAFHNKTGMIDSFNIERSGDGLFNLKGSQRYTCPDHPEVFSLKDGPCPEPAKADPNQNCPYELIPILSKEGYAEWALQFDGSDDRIILEQDFTAENAAYQTIEFWLKPAHLDGPQTLLASSPEETAGAIAIESDGTLQYHFQSGTTRNPVEEVFISAAALSAGEWAHVALVRDNDAGRLTWYVNGAEAGVMEGITKPAPTAASLFLGAGPWSHFQGQIDEVRLWSRPRGGDELREDMRHRLIGHEPGLFLYWRFDEGSGSTVNDQSEFANRGRLEGGVEWLASDAPVGDHPGVRRTSFGFDGRAVVTGMSALLYYHQKNNKSGYDGQEKPLKTNARVMLAVGTHELDGGTPEVNHIAILDFGLSREGKLGQVPDNIQLQNIEVTGDRTRTSREIQNEINYVEGTIPGFETLVAELKGDLGIPVDEPFLDAALRELAATAGEEKAVFLRGHVTIKQGAEGIEYATGDPADPRLLAKAGWRYPAGEAATFIKTADGAMVTPVEPVDPAAPLEPEQIIGTPEWLALWCDWENEEGRGEAAVAMGNRYYFFKGNRYRVFDAENRAFGEPTLISEGEFPGLWAEGVDAAFDVSADTIMFFQGLSYRSYQLGEDGFTHLEMGNFHDVYPGVPFLFTHPEYGGNLPDLAEVEAQLEALRQRLTALRLELAEAQRRELENLEIEIEMHMVHTDPFGLSTMGGLLTFAWTANAPLLFDSANGKLALYFQGANEQFYVAYYDTMTSAVSFELPAGNNSRVRLLPRLLGPVQGIEIQVQGDDPEICTVILKDDTLGFSETWENVPREVAAFAAVINGQGAPQFLGRLLAETSGTVSGIRLAHILPEVLHPGRMLGLGTAQSPIIETVPLRALAFDGQNDYVSLPEPFIGPAGTLELWLRIPDTGGSQPIFDASTPQSGNVKGKFFYLDIHSRKLRFGMEDQEDRDYEVEVSLNSLSPGEGWHHVAVVWNYESSAVLRLYFDGEQVDGIDSQQPTAGVPVFLNPFLGKSRSDYVTSGAFRGEIAELRFRSEALSTEAVQDAFALGVMGADPLVTNGCWRFRLDGETPRALDESGYGNHGEILGGGEIVDIEGGGVLVKIAPLTLPAVYPAGEPVYADYDYEANTLFNHRGRERRSVLFAIDPSAAEGRVNNAAVSGAAMPSPMTRWIAYAQGSALEFDGQSGDVAEKDGTKLPNFNADGDLTVEAWVRPEPVVNRDFSRVVHHYSDASLYLLGLKRKPLKSAFNFSASHEDKARAWAAKQYRFPFFNVDWATAAVNAALVAYNLPNSNARSVALAAERASRNAIQTDFFFLETLEKYERNRVGELSYAWAYDWYLSHKDYVEIDDAPDLNPGSAPWSVECWFRADRTSGWNIIYNKNRLFEAAVHNGYLEFAWVPHWVWVKVDPFPVAQGRWYHLVITYDGQKQEVYKDGEKIFERNQTGEMGGSAFNFMIGGRYFDNGTIGDYFKGAIDEVRIWSEVRQGSDILAFLNRRLRGDEKNLRGYWHFDQGIARDYASNGHHGFVKGTPVVANSIMPGFSITAGVGNKIENGFSDSYIQTRESIPFFEWNHLAMVYNASYGLRFANDAASLDCGNNASLSLEKDLTLEAFFRLDDLRQPRGIITKGEVQPGYSLHVNTAGRLVFTFRDEDGQEREFVADAASRLTVGNFYRVAVTRRHQSETRNVKERRTINGETVEVEVPVVEEWDDIELHICRWTGGRYQRHIGYSQKYHGPKPGSNSERLLIGRGPLRSSGPFKGIISEVRVWNRALGRFETCQNLTGQESGLISWWRLDENRGYAAEDATGSNHASINQADWIKNPDPLGPSFKILHNGVFMETEAVSAPGNARGSKAFRLGPLANGTVKDAFKGTLEELRVWRTVRTQEQIQDNLFLRLLGEKEDLTAYYTFDQVETAVLQDHSFRGNHLPVEAAAFVVSDAPISYDSYQVRNALLAVKTAFHDKIHAQPGVQEYGDMQYDAEGNLIGILKRCYSYVKDGKWHLVTGYKVGNLITEWIGQVQFNPELKGFIEGAPPVPSENLTAGPIDPSLFDYAGSAAVEVVEAESVSYNYATSKEAGLSASFGLSASLGVDTTVLLITAPLGIGTAQEVADVNVLVGLEGKFNAAAGWSSENSVGVGRNLTRSTKVSLGGNWEDPNHQLNQAMRRRYQPANMGFALVQSETADVFALRLSHNLALVSFAFRPNPDIPKDWNIIPFPINPRYTKQGTLDGAVGYDEQGKVLDPDYPNAAEYGQHSYFKPKEAYSIKNRIIKEEQELANYFRSVDTNLGGAPDLAISAGLGLISGAAEGGAAGAVNGLVSALSSNTGLPEKLGKQNIVNTYVWTADGGFFAETTETMLMKQETTGGNFSFSGEVGASIGVDFSVGGADVSLGFSAMLGGSLNLTKTKTKSSENSFRIDLEIGIPGDLQAYDENLVRQYDPEGNPVIVPGKVDAYRFMTFYLEPANDNFEAFFNTVVDPIWLQGAHPNALALKQAQQSDKKPPCWRVMHRVTFVSRILPEIPPESAPPLEKNLKAANVESNWQLIKKLEPFVRNKTANFVEFSDAIRKAIATYLPELSENVPEVIAYLSAYYQVYDE